jgi:outer membrane immunogenic protein
LKRLMVVALLAFGTAGQALAADLPQPPPPQAPVAYVPTVEPVYNWGGIYFGVNGGYGFGNSEWTDPANPSISALSSTGTFDVTGFLVGATLGANFQTDAWVFGIDGDFDASWLDGKSSSPFCSSVGFTGGQCETKNTWLGTLRGRVGYAADRVLFYVTGGGAYGNIEAGIGSGFSNSSEPGWTAGAGVEAAFADNWTARLEYLYVDLENGSCNSPGTCGLDKFSPPVSANDAVKFNANLIRFGVDYKFR